MSDPRSAPAPADYHRMGIAAKQRHALERMREPAVVCPACETQVPPADMPAHLSQRCTGRRDPHPAAAWVTWAEALRLVGARSTLAGWVRRGEVRIKGEVQDRRYLLRDITVLMARQRRKFAFANREPVPGERE